MFNSFCLLLSGLGLGWLVGLSISPVIQTVLASLVAVVVSLSSALAGLRPSEPEVDDSQETGSAKDTGHRRRRRFPILLDPLPVMTMVIGLAFGTAVGIYARTNDLLGSRNNLLVEEWKDTGLTAKEITTRVFDSLYPPSSNGESALQEHAPTPPTDQNTNSTQTQQQPSNTNQAQEKGNHVSPRRTTQGTTATMEQQSQLSRHTLLFSVSLEQCVRLKNADDEDELKREMASSNDDYLVELATKTCKTFECLKAGVRKACAKYK